MYSNRFYVYALLDPRKSKCKYGEYKFKHEPFYIGKGTSNRTKAHGRIVGGLLLAEKYNVLKYRITHKILRLTGRLPVIIYINKDMEEDEAFKLESELIEIIGRRDLNRGPLSNLTNGGEGVRGYIATPELCLKRSERIKNLSPENRAAWVELVSKGVRAYLERTTREERAKYKKINEYVKRMSEEGKRLRYELIAKGNKRFWASLTEEERKEKGRIQTEFYQYLSKEEKEELAIKKTRHVVDYWSTVTAVELQRLKSVWSENRKLAWTNRDEKERKIIGNKISKSKISKRKSYLGFSKGSLTVIDEIFGCKTNRGTTLRKFVCRCVCGNTKTSTIGNLHDRSTCGKIECKQIIRKTVNDKQNQNI